ncbi:MAG: cupredoxin domain-containing protein [Thaumarchaeota archaeon]|nr:cupredoxin domain-containing protein [Nitrososphaerota archaeon]
MKFQEYGPPKLTLGVIGVIAAIVPILLGYFLVTGLATSSSYNPAPTASTTSTTTSGAGGTVAVSIPSGAGNPANPPGYAPDKITVVIGTNASVTWSNDDTAAHTVSSVTVPSGAASFDSGNMNAGQTFTYNFTMPGTYEYHCSYHSWMTGTVVVVAGAAAVKVSMPSGANNPNNPPGYAPDKVTLVVGVNNTVTWSNDDTAAHTVSSVTVPTGATSFDSGNMNAGQTFTYTFTIPGTYQYHCNYHSWMTGTVTVVAGNSTANQPAG